MHQAQDTPKALEPISAISPPALALAYGTVFSSAVAPLIFLVNVAYPFIPGEPSLSWWLLAISFQALLLFVVAFFPGNLAAMLPFSIDVLPGEGVRLGIPFRTVWIPIGDVVDVDVSSTTLFWRKSYEVELAKSHGLIRSFYISPAFGNQRDVVVEAIRDALIERDSN